LKEGRTGDMADHIFVDYDVLGKLILNKDKVFVSNFQTNIDLTSAAKGVYFVKINIQGQKTVKRIVKE
jgi:hypothetical protein